MGQNKKICSKLQENASKSKVPRGMPSDPPGAHTCDERTASLSPTPHAPPPSKILDPPL